MNRENAKSYIPLLEALADGELEINEGTECTPKWISTNCVEFSYGPNFYRRRPKPREVWVVVDANGKILDCCVEKEAAERYQGYAYFRAVEVTQ